MPQYTYSDNLRAPSRGAYSGRWMANGKRAPQLEETDACTRVGDWKHRTPTRQPIRKWQDVFVDYCSIFENLEVSRRKYRQAPVMVKYFEPCLTPSVTSVIYLTSDDFAGDGSFREFRPGCGPTLSSPIHSCGDNHQVIIGKNHISEGSLRKIARPFMQPGVQVEVMALFLKGNDEVMSGLFEEYKPVEEINLITSVLSLLILNGGSRLNEDGMKSAGKVVSIVPGLVDSNRWDYQLSEEDIAGIERLVTIVDCKESRFVEFDRYVDIVVYNL
ncbi:hypothetical protein FOL47_008814 [Perkinsus chesapeaki]|uniref:Uncharacterized protein n=1 Tax=Perkinsus chesapeaki TaxID=330153 RepID=A0A7J6LCH8_PERCH|nr:hypothetical protein FOL47_008814 [Perkinsus chesapeaki]